MSKSSNELYFNNGRRKRSSNEEGLISDAKEAMELGMTYGQKKAEEYKQLIFPNRVSR